MSAHNQCDRLSGLWDCRVSEDFVAGLQRFASASSFVFIITQQELRNCTFNPFCQECKSNNSARATSYPRCFLVDDRLLALRASKHALQCAHQQQPFSAAVALCFSIYNLLPSPLHLICIVFVQCATTWYALPALPLLHEILLQRRALTLWRATSCSQLP